MGSCGAYRGAGPPMVRSRRHRPNGGPQDSSPSVSADAVSLRWTVFVAAPYPGSCFPALRATAEEDLRIIAILQKSLVALAKQERNLSRLDLLEGV